MTEVRTLLTWVGDGQQRVEDAVAALAPEQVHEPSRLPGWTRGHVITHLARNADALINLLAWADTGVPSPMYRDPDQRNADIEAGAGRPLDEQLIDLRDAGRRFVEAASVLPAEKWAARVRSAQGRDIPASDVPWLRTREVWIHLVDLDAGFDVDGLPDDVAIALVRDVAAWMSPKVASALELRPDGHSVVRLGRVDGAVDATLAGPASRIAGWLIGRSDAAGLTGSGAVPDLPGWL